MPHPMKIRPMNRRRFVPSQEGLELRQLQATNLTSIFGAQITSNLNIPITYEQKALRIKRLPYYLDKISEGPRFLPQAEITADPELRSSRCSIQSRSPPRRRSTITTTSSATSSRTSRSSGSDIKRLNYSFGAVLHSAKTPTGVDQRPPVGPVYPDLSDRYRQRAAGQSGHQRLLAHASDRPGNRPSHAPAASPPNQEK